MSGILQSSETSMKVVVVPPGLADWVPWTYATGVGQLILSLPNSAISSGTYSSTWDEWDGAGKNVLVISTPAQAVIDGSYVSGWEYWDGASMGKATISLPSSAILNA